MHTVKLIALYVFIQNLEHHMNEFVLWEAVFFIEHRRVEVFISKHKPWPILVQNLLWSVGRESTLILNATGPASNQVSNFSVTKSSVAHSHKIVKCAVPVL